MTKNLLLIFLAIPLLNLEQSQIVKQSSLILVFSQIRFLSSQKINRLNQLKILHRSGHSMGLQAIPAELPLGRELTPSNPVPNGIMAQLAKNVLSECEFDQLNILLKSPFGLAESAVVLLALLKTAVTLIANRVPAVDIKHRVLGLILLVIILLVANRTKELFHLQIGILLKII